MNERNVSLMVLLMQSARTSEIIYDSESEMIHPPEGDEDKRLSGPNLWLLQFLTTNTLKKTSSWIILLKQRWVLIRTGTNDYFCKSQLIRLIVSAQVLMDLILSEL